MRRMLFVTALVAVFVASPHAVVPAHATAPCESFPGWTETGPGYGAWLTNVYAVNTTTGNSFLLDGFVDAAESFNVPEGYVIRGKLNMCAPDTNPAKAIINFSDAASVNNSWNSQDKITPTQTGVQIIAGTWYQIVPNDGMSFLMTPKANKLDPVVAHAVGPAVTINPQATGLITPISHTAGPANAAFCTGPAAGNQALVENVTCDELNGCGYGHAFGSTINPGDQVSNKVAVRWEIHVCIASYNANTSYSSGVWVDQFGGSPLLTSWENQHYRGKPWASGVDEFNEFEYQTTPTTGSGEIEIYPRLFVDATESEGPTPDSHIDREGPEYSFCVNSC